MEKVLKPHDKEFMRMAMLKHEETFREQVYELHRLYRIQKMLMNTTVGVNKQQNDHQQKQDQIRSHVADQIRASSFAVDNQRQQAQRNTDDQVGTRLADHHTPHQERIAESNNNNNQMIKKIDESEIELTLSLGPTTYTRRRLRPDKSESGQSVSSSSTGSSQTRKISPKDSRMSSTRDFTWGAATGNIISNNNNKNTFSHQGSESVDPGFSNGQQNNPPWMFQALSLKLS